MRTPIELPVKHKLQLADEFGCTLQTVRMALMWINNSELAGKIRRRARELLLAEAGQIKNK